MEDIDVALEERDNELNGDLERSKLYFKTPSNAKIPDIDGDTVKFEYGSLKEFEVFGMLLGRSVLKKTKLELVEGCAAAWSDTQHDSTLIIFPGAGSWFGTIDHSKIINDGLQKGTFLPYIDHALNSSFNVVQLCPLLLKYNQREIVYKRHVDYVLPKVLERYPNSRICILAFSLGGKFALKSLKRHFNSSSNVKVCLIDSICHDLRGKKDMAMYRRVCLHLTCSEEPRKEDNGMAFQWCGTSDHREAAFLSKEAAFDYFKNNNASSCALF